MSELVKLADLCVKITDGSHYSPQGIDRGYPMLSSKDMQDFDFDFSQCKYISENDYKKMVENDCKPLVNDVLIIKDGNSYLQKVFVIREERECAILSSIGVLRPNILKLNPYYLKYYLSSEFVKKEVAKKYVTGSALPRIILKNFGNIEIPYIDLSLQEKVVSILKLIDLRIENNNKVNLELESMAKSIFDYWFLQFDFPDENGKPYKSSGGKMVWNEELKREIPEGWCAGTLNRYIAKDKGGDWGKEVEEGNYIKRVICLRGADFPSITGNSELVAPVRYILEKNICKILENGDLIIEISGGSPTQSTGRICYINHNLLERFDTDIVTSNFCKAISLNESNYMYWFYIQWLKIYDNNVLFMYEGKTTGIKNLLFDIFVNDYKIAVPPDELIIQYNNIVCVMFEEIQKKQKESQELASLRDFLLPLLMNGQVGFK